MLNEKICRANFQNITDYVSRKWIGQIEFARKSVERFMSWRDFVASKRFEKDSEEWSMFREYWALCQQFWEPEDNDEYWERVIDSTNEFYKKYKENNEIFAKEIALALVDTLDKKSRNKKN